MLGPLGDEAGAADDGAAGAADGVDAGAGLGTGAVATVAGGVTVVAGVTAGAVTGGGATTTGVGAVMRGVITAVRTIDVTSLTTVATSCFCCSTTAVIGVMSADLFGLSTNNRAARRLSSCAALSVLIEIPPPVPPAVPICTACPRMTLSAVISTSPLANVMGLVAEPPVVLDRVSNTPALKAILPEPGLLAVNLGKAAAAYVDPGAAPEASSADCSTTEAFAPGRNSVSAVLITAPSLN